MLSTRNASLVCLSCRLHLLSFLKSGILAHAPNKSFLLPHCSASPRVYRKILSHHNSTWKKFNSSVEKPHGDENKPSNNEGFHNNTPSNSNDQRHPSDDVDAEAQIDSIVRQARQTFGDTLPKDYLSKEELVVYERLFGPPLRETTADDLEFVITDDNPPLPKAQNMLLKKNEDGVFEEVAYEISSDNFTGETSFIEASDGKNLVDGGLDGESENFNSSQPEENDLQIQYNAQNEREILAIAKLQKGMRFRAKSTAGNIKLSKQENVGDIEKKEIDDEIYEEDEEEEEEEGLDLYNSSDASRTHPHTIAGRSRPNPSTIYLPIKEYVAPVTELLTRTKPLHLKLAAEKAFGGEGLPYSISVPNSMKHMPQKEIGLDASQHRMSDIEADVYLSTIMPGAYASIMNILVEVRKRLGQGWIRELIMRKDGDGPKVLDAGSGGAGIIAWRKIMETEWELMKADGDVEGEFIHPGKDSIVTGSDCLRHRASKLLENTTFLPRIPDYVHATQSHEDIKQEIGTGRKMYDIVIAPHTLLPQKENYKRKNMIKNLWTLVNPKGGILIVIEKGIPRGFEAVAEARSFILKTFIASPGSHFVENDLDLPEFNEGRLTVKEEGMIIAPCTNHKTCPMYLNPGNSRGRKDYCHFPQRFIRPPFLQKVLGAKARNHEDAKFSYIVFRRGIDLRKVPDSILIDEQATEQSFEGYEEHDLPDSHQGEDYVNSHVHFNTLSLPRVILSPLKRHGHVTLDLCTPSAQIERWIVPKSFSKVAYRDARKSKWGDLWALGAKTRIKRNIRLGKVTDARMDMTHITSNRKLVKKYNIIVGKDGFERFERAGKSVVDKSEKRTKRGRYFKESRPVGEDDF
ncbi:putative S-adenosyl-L-methionine-dependent RNA methyltransferase RSM22, mitochondrial [Golovinomyces cichoracearum]|uniref:Putative S-adenosyl-L-methionine-dependent RNA methyltransferase RSM22, mitochondrial n=1 Tax=Golovinomyces cichoracearum TaxID=62708 RepID=A0A420HUN1_9PEZI|nr:putative S-adenosyl-L-methionine-dependent RNA methyltransferase RSM22, mitochondrial [Golovinomyces cichoracearum]